MRSMTAGGRLFRKYAAVLILLVGGVLLLSSLVNLYFSYRETKAARDEARHVPLLASRRERARHREQGHLLAFEHIRRGRLARAVGIHDREGCIGKLVADFDRH